MFTNGWPPQKNGADSFTRVLGGCSIFIITGGPARRNVRWEWTRNEYRPQGLVKTIDKCPIPAARGLPARGDPFMEAWNHMVTRSDEDETIGHPVRRGYSLPTATVCFKNSDSNAGRWRNAAIVRGPVIGLRQA
jgi:hypothetical protein